MSSCILYSSATVTLIDIPRSIEQAQSFSLSSSPRRRRLLSQQPLEHPYSSLEPKTAKAKAAAAAAAQPSLEDLILQKHLQFALDELKEAYDGPWCLPRVTVKNAGRDGDRMKERKKRKLGPVGADADADAYAEADSIPVPVPVPVPALNPLGRDGMDEENVVLAGHCFYFHNTTQRGLNAIFGSNREEATIPSQSQVLQGDITETVGIFKDAAPGFDVIVLDPPWPNRSARRKGAYAISYGPPEIRSLLSFIALHDYVVEGGFIAVWVTNKPSCRELMLGKGGLFEEWGVKLVEEWLWLKVTRNGDPVCCLDATWKKPYEVLLVGQRCRRLSLHADVKRRVLVGVPDVHSRKPNLRCLLESLVDKREGSYEALEIFARNLTAGWWSWGNEVLKFQTPEHWAES